MLRPEHAEEWPMAEAYEPAITTEDLREAIKAKISEGVSRRDISLLITTYAQPGPFAGRPEDGLQRLPVELIPAKCRCEFLATLCQLEASVTSGPQQHLTTLA
jgi:hypothetical protein